MTKANEIKAIFVAAFGAVSAFIGWAIWLFLIWGVLLFVDWMTGSEAARMNGTWNSTKSKEGRLKKKGCFYMVALALALDIVIWLSSNVITVIDIPWDYKVMLLPIVLLWYILIDAGSIIENVALMGAPVPEWLKKGIEKAQDAIDEQGDKIVDAIEANCNENNKEDSDGD